MFFNSSTTSTGTLNGDCPKPNLNIFFPCFSNSLEVSLIARVEDGFKFLSDKAYMPTFALGGLNINDLDESLKSSGYGISGISNFWN